MTSQISSTRLERATKARHSTLIGIATNGTLAIIKAAAGILGHSYALVADAIESSSDVVSSIIVYMGLRVAAQPPSETHPYGKGRAETIAAAIVAVMLLIAAVLIGRQSVYEIITPHHAPAPFTLGVLLFVVIVKEGLFRFVIKVGEETSSAAVTADAWHHRSDAITSAAAFIGISIALIGGKGYEVADDWAALLASTIIAINGWTMLMPALQELTDASPDKSLIEQVRTIAQEVDGVRGTHRCWMRKLGFDHYVDLDVMVDETISVRDGHDIAHRVQDEVRTQMPLITRVTVHIEPDDEAKRWQK